MKPIRISSEYRVRYQSGLWAIDHKTPGRKNWELACDALVYTSRELAVEQAEFYAEKSR